MGGKLCGTFLMIQPSPQLPQRLTQGQAHQIAPGAAHHIGNEIGDVAGAVKKGLQQLNGGAADGSLQQCQEKALSCAVRHQDAKRQKEENIQQNLAHTVAPAVEQIPKRAYIKGKGMVCNIRQLTEYRQQCQGKDPGEIEIQQTGKQKPTAGYFLPSEPDEQNECKSQYTQIRQHGVRSSLFADMEQYSTAGG